jgi:hypothetical protein
MSAAWIGFVCGMFLGSVGGVFVMALCFAARRGNDLHGCHCDSANQGRACRTCEEVGHA